MARNFNVARLRRLVSFLSYGRVIVDVLGLLGLSLYLLRFGTVYLFLDSPATGGDMGSHYWPLLNLVEESLPNGTIRNWNPGNLGGEPHLVHYFPMPYLIMSFLALVFPTAMAYNFGTLLPAFLMPVAAYSCCRGIGGRFPAPIFAASCSLLMLYNEGQSMWGGNLLSVMAGQFAHLYGIVFLLFAIGAMGAELRRDRVPVLGGILSAAVLCSHAYAAIAVPFIMLGFVCVAAPGKRLRTLVNLFLSGVLSLCASLWFLVPMLDNAPWTTPFPVEWKSEKIWQEFLPPIFSIIFIMAAAVVLLPIAFGLLTARLSGVRLKLFASRAVKVMLFWLPSFIGYGVCYKIFVSIGLVDVRALPQIQIFAAIAIAHIFALFLSYISQVLAWFASPLAVVFVMQILSVNVTKLPQWMEWNYSGWQRKALYFDLKRLTDSLQGDFADPRVVYEHNPYNHGTGTVRVFEMLPYFARRATLESTYLQASILAPMAFHIQARVSEKPSCPFRQYPCPPMNLGIAKDQLRLMGVRDLIFLTESVLSQANKIPDYKKGELFGKWQMYQLAGEVPLVDFFQAPPELVPTLDWKDEFYTWFEKYTEGASFLIASLGNESPSVSELLQDSSIWKAPKDCHPELKVSFGRIELLTQCPGVPHYLKFAFHPTWRSDSGEEIYLVSPGFMMLLPRGERVVLRFGDSVLWSVSSYASVVIIFASFVAIFVRRRRDEGL